MKINLLSGISFCETTRFFSNYKVGEGLVKKGKRLRAEQEYREFLSVRVLSRSRYFPAAV
jgi:hypothetical protein